MSKLLIFIGMTVGSYMGWWLGDFQGLWTAVLLSTLLGAVGVIAGWKISQML